MELVPLAPMVKFSALEDGQEDRLIGWRRRRSSGTIMDGNSVRKTEVPMFTVLSDLV
jgi:hypothetical protein